MSKLKKIGKIILSIILWIIILLAALFAIVTLAAKDPNNLGSILGYTPLSVQTESMTPTFDPGDMIIIKKVDPATLQIGDIVTFHTIIENQYALNSHRIVQIFDKGLYREFMTKGDNNLVVDSALIVDSDIAGKYVTKIPKLGKVMDFLGGKLGFFVVILLPLLLFFIYQVYHLVMVAIEYKNVDAIETALAAEAAKKEIAGNNDEKAESIQTPVSQAEEDEINKMREEAARMLAEAKKAQEEAAARLEALKALEENPDDKKS